MAIRTTAQLVLDLFADLTEEDRDLYLQVNDAGKNKVDPSIEAANAIVDAVCLDSGYTDILLELIERWLAAHFFCMLVERRAKSEAVTGVAGVSASYEGLTRLGFEYTPYGQHAKLLDFDGNLAELEAEQAASKAKFKAVFLHVGEAARWAEAEPIEEETV